MGLAIFGDFSFVGGDDTSANPWQDRQQTINYYVEISPSGAAKMPTSLLGCPGLIQLAGSNNSGANGTVWPQPSSITNLPVRGMWPLPGGTTAIAVIGNGAYLVTLVTPGSSTIPGVIVTNKIGTINTNNGPVAIRDNGVEGTAVIVDGPYGYYYAYSKNSPLGNGTFQSISDPNFLGSNTVAFIDGWWIFNQPGTQTFYTNAQPYSLAFDGSYFALKDAYRDQLIGVIESKEELWLVGKETTEIWYDAGGQYFPFQRLVGTMIQVGCKAVASICRLNSDQQDGLIWFGTSQRGDNIIVRTKGFSYDVVSTPAVSDAIAKYTVTADAIGYVYQEDGHEFYVLTFPTADRTWCFDASLPLEYAWHQRLSFDPYADKFHRHRSNCYMNFGGMRIVGDYQNGAIYQLTRSSYTDAGWPLLARRRAPHVWNAQNRERVFLCSLQIDFAIGQAPSSGIGSSPVARLRVSKDGGATFGRVFISSMAKVGQTLKRTIWRKLGFARDSVVEIEVIDPVCRDITGATLKAIGP